MYLNHFGLKESPFAITPNPRFVFLSDRHREALAHLLYGLGEGGGFVQLTGEVGTGKTTICRTLLQQLPEHVDVALVFNPQLTVPELLDSLCTELGIAFPAVQTESIKARIDWLYAHLLDANARGRRTVLIIDEAQNLGVQLLEEVRLLTNLETDHVKLLQVFLIGQPELRDKLASDEMRQLAQRVTARYHLEPLTLEETGLYVRHRLSVSGCSRELFTPAALRAVQRLSKGIPRRINILCDRALLGAYTVDSERVSAAIVRRAAAEVRGAAAPRPVSFARYAAGVAGLAGVLAVGALALGLAPELGGSPDGVAVAAADRVSASVTGPASDGDVGPALPPVLAPAVAIVEPPAEVAIGAVRVTTGAPPPPLAQALPERMPAARGLAAPVADVDPSRAPTLETLVASLDHDGWEAAIDELARLWSVPGPLPGADTCTWARQEALACHSRQEGAWTTLREMDLPAVLRLAGPGEASVHVLMTAQSDHDAAISIAGRRLRVERDVLERLWDGGFLLLWRPPLRNVHQIMLGHTGQRVRWLSESLASIDGREPSGAGTRFDAGLEDRVKAFQRAQGLSVDGIVGPETFIHLVKRTAVGGLPTLQAEPGVVASAAYAASEVSR